MGAEGSTLRRYEIEFEDEKWKLKRQAQEVKAEFRSQMEWMYRQVQEEDQQERHERQTSEQQKNQDRQTRTFMEMQAQMSQHAQQNMMAQSQNAMMMMMAMMSGRDDQLLLTYNNYGMPQMGGGQLQLTFEESDSSEDELTKIKEEQKRSREELTKIKEEQKRSREVGNAPGKPYLADLDIRLGTFKDWPADSPVSPRALAKAGFYHDTKFSSMASAPDCCRCFHCEDRISGWKLDDDPFVEHARLSPKSCLFIKQCKGEAFILAARMLAKSGGQVTKKQVEAEISAAGQKKNITAESSNSEMKTDTQLLRHL